MTTVEDLLQLAFQSSSEGSDASQASDVVILKADLPDDGENFLATHVEFCLQYYEHGCQGKA